MLNIDIQQFFILEGLDVRLTINLLSLFFKDLIVSNKKKKKIL